MKPICVPCQRFFHPEKNGFTFTEGMPMNGSVRVPPGTSNPELWKPYKVWIGDKWKCKGCGAEIIVGTGTTPIAIQHEEDFTKTQKEYGADQFQVNDC